MKLGRAISSLLLAIYLVASCGSMLSVILCHCTRSQHYPSHHCCSHVCHHNHHDTGEGINLPSKCGCNHDHSTEIDLYNYEKSFIADFSPIVCTALPDMQGLSEVVLENCKLKYLDRRKIPLPESEYISIRGLRAPPVIA